MRNKDRVFRFTWEQVRKIAGSSRPAQAVYATALRNPDSTTGGGWCVSVSGVTRAVEEELEKTFSVSRVREALLELKEQGLVELSWGSGGQLRALRVVEELF